MIQRTFIVSTFIASTFIAFICAGALGAQEVILEVPFDTIPDEVRVVSDHIGLEGNVLVAGEVETTVGLRFPDGTLQSTAALGGGDSEVNRSLTANGGLYSNRIVDFVPPEAYVEICFKGGSVLADIHAISESTAGGACVPGDTGWIIERLERSAGATGWTTARATCLMHGMRLPEPFEWQYACENAGALGVSDMIDGWEWASNSSEYFNSSGGSGVVVEVFGNGACSRGSGSSMGRGSGSSPVHTYRCVR